MTEEWKDIEGYEGLYQVSTLGRVRSLPRISCQGHPLKGGYRKPQNRSGYLSICLHKEGVWSKYLMHRLVATTFIPNPENKPEVNHIDGNKHNNRVENLEWCTKSENLMHASKVLHRFGTRVVRVEDGKVFDSIRDAAQVCGVKCSGNISMCLRNINHTAGGYHWKYLE